MDVSPCGRASQFMYKEDALNLIFCMKFDIVVFDRNDMVRIMNGM